jgi:hypothetical protein
LNIAATGEETRKTEGVRGQTRLAVEEARGRIKKDLMALPNAQERISYREGILKQAMQEKELAVKSGDAEKALAMDKEIQQMKGAQAMEQLVAGNNNDVKMAADKFTRDAALQAQREGGDLLKTLSDASGNIYMDDKIKAAINEKLTSALGGAAVAPVASPVASTAEAGQATSGDQNADGVYSQEEKDYDSLAQALEAEPSPAKKLRIKAAMDNLKKQLLTPR